MNIAKRILLILTFGVVFAPVAFAGSSSHSSKSLFLNQSGHTTGQIKGVYDYPAGSTTCSVDADKPGNAFSNNENMGHATAQSARN